MVKSFGTWVQDQNPTQDTPEVQQPAQSEPQADASPTSDAIAKIREKFQQLKASQEGGA